MITIEARRAFWLHYRNAQDLLLGCKGDMQLLEAEFEALARVMKDDPTLVENGFRHVVNQATELARYAREIEQSIDRKRTDGIEADKRIDAMIGTVN